MKNLIFGLFLLSLQPALAENTEVIKCRVTNSDWQSVIVVDSLGGGILKFQKTGDSNFYACSMKLSAFSDMRGGVVPMLRATLNLGACDPDISRYRDKILKTQYLQITFGANSANEGTIQWMQDRQPDACTVEKIRLDDLHEYSVKWSQGKWGRRPASAPEKFKKKF